MLYSPSVVDPRPQPPYVWYLWLWKIIMFLNSDDWNVLEVTKIMSTRGFMPKKLISDNKLKFENFDFFEFSENYFGVFWNFRRNVGRKWWKNEESLQIKMLISQNERKIIQNPAVDISECTNITRKQPSRVRKHIKLHARLKTNFQLTISSGIPERVKGRKFR